ncbi:hypothetical protein ACTSKR_09290 [Chitinibacteraceae bacterium HSL-7]
MSALTAWLQGCAPGGQFACVDDDDERLQQRLDQLAACALALSPGGVAVLESEGGFVNNLRVWENLVLPAWYHRGGEAAHLEDRLEEVLALSGWAHDELQEWCGLLPSKLSRDQRRRLAVLRAALMRPRWVLADAGWYGWYVRQSDRGVRRLLAEMLTHATLVVAARSRTPLEELHVFDWPEADPT